MDQHNEFEHVLELGLERFDLSVRARKLIGPDPDNAGSITLSEAGWHFASLPNPLLDSLPAGKFQKFTDEETDFLLEHKHFHLRPQEASTV